MKVNFNRPDYSSLDSFLSPRIGPFSMVLFMHRYKILASLKKILPFFNGDLLDVGCGIMPYKSLFKSNRYIGVDVETSVHDNQFDFVFDGQKLPFDENSFDCILCTEVIEHCTDPQVLFSEFNRVLKNNGYAFITAPMFLEHHEIPYDLRRLTYYGMVQLSKKNGFNVIWCDDRGSVFWVFIQAFYLLLSQMISRRPFSDIAYFLAFPFMLLLFKLDFLRKKSPPVISLGWQMLVQKI